MLCHDVVFLTEDMSREQNKKKAKERANEEELTRRCMLFHANCSFVFSCFFFFLLLFMCSSLNGQQHDDDEDEKDHH